MTNHEALTCQEVVELVTEYLENAPLPEMPKQLEGHIDDCPGCATYLKQVRQTVVLLHQIARETAFPASLREMLRISNWKRAASIWEWDDS